jgi:hypothetical protein
MSGKGAHMTQPRAKLVAGPLDLYVGGIRGRVGESGLFTLGGEAPGLAFGEPEQLAHRTGVDEWGAHTWPRRAFVEERRVRGYKSWISMRSMVLPVEYLRSVGAVPLPVSTIVEDPVEEVVTPYRRYLTDQRGLAKSTIEHYERIGRLFLSDQLDLHAIALGRLSAADVTTFVGRECPRRSTP